MENAVCSLGPRLDAMPHPAVDVDADMDASTGAGTGADLETDRGADASIVHFATNTSSHGDDDMKGSDGWRLASDASTISSRVTTPDLQPRPLSSRTVEPPESSSASVLSPLAPPPSSLPTYHTSGLEQNLYSIKSSRFSTDSTIQLRTPPLDPPEHDVLQTHTQRHGSTRLPQQPSVIPPPPAPSCSLRCSGGKSLRAGLIRSPPPPPPPPARVTHHQKQNTSAIQQQRHPLTTPQRWLGPVGPVIGEERALVRSRSRSRSKRKNRSRKVCHIHQGETSSESALSTSSLTRPFRAMSWSSDSTSEEDPVAYRNSRQFPPQLPAPPVSRPSPQSRSLATSRITSWVSQYELRSARRIRVGGTAPLPPPSLEELGSPEEASILSDESPYAEVELLWQQLKEKRAKLSGIKRRMSERRQQLRSLRRRKDEADNALMSVIRPMLVSQRVFLQIPFQLLDSRMADIQGIQDDYHVQESDYEALELKMDKEEKELSGLETKFFSLLAAGQDRPERATSDKASSRARSYSPSNVPYELRGILADKPSEDVHPLYFELTSAVGDLENAKEEYDDLLYINDQYETEFELAKTTGKKNSADMEEFLEEFPTEETRMKAEVLKLEAEVQRLKKLCEEKRVMRKHMSARMLYALSPHTKFEDMELEDRASILARHKSLAHPVFAEILSQPDHVLAEPEPLTSRQALRAAARLPREDPSMRDKQRLAAKEFSIDMLIQGDGAGERGDFVNRWLLHQLRLSPLSVQLLHSTFVCSRSLKIRDVWRWQRDVLYYWWRDNTVALTESKDNRIKNTLSNHSSRLGTPQMSRAASDGHLGPPCKNRGRLESDRALTASE